MVKIEKLHKMLGDPILADIYFFLNDGMWHTRNTLLAWLHACDRPMGDRQMRIYVEKLRNKLLDLDTEMQLCANPEYGYKIGNDVKEIIATLHMFESKFKSMATTAGKYRKHLEHHHNVRMEEVIQDAE